ncbi:MAG: DUF1995 family protein [Synechococcales bacterium]|nr:DUF1995 family protein [Synechococcales bacterium]
MTQLPKSLDDAIAQARDAATAAVNDGYKRLQVEILIPELKVMPVAAQFIPAFENFENKLRVIFPDAGAAALARRDWGEKPYIIRGIQDLKADIQPEEELFIFVEPSSVEVTQVEEMCNQAGDRPVIFLNPSLEDVATIGIGYAGRQLRERFLNTFESCYYLRPLEGSALFRCYPSPWQVWRETEGDYELAGEQAQRPTAEEIERLLIGDLASSGETAPGATPRPRKGILSGLQDFLRALSQ